MRQTNNLGCDHSGKAGFLGIDFQNALPVIRRCFCRKHSARTQGKNLAQVLILGSMVPLKHDPVDDRVLLELDEQRAALAPQGYILEQPRCVKGFQGTIEVVLRKGVTGADNHIGQDRIGLDTGIA